MWAVKEGACDECLRGSVPHWLTCLQKADWGAMSEFCGDECWALHRGHLISDHLDSVKSRWTAEGHGLPGVRGGMQRLRQCGQTLSGNLN